MKGIGYKLSQYRVVGVKPGFNLPEEGGLSAFEELSETSFPAKWKILYFYPKDFTFICPTEIEAFAFLNDRFRTMNAILMGGNLDNEFAKLAWRRENAALSRLNHYSFSDPKGSLVDQLEVRDSESGVPIRATFIIDGQNVVQHCSAYNLNVGRSPEETLRVLDALSTSKMCSCNRQIGGPTL